MMKKNILLGLGILATIFFTACEKNIEGGGNIATYSNGKLPVLAASAATVAPVAADSNKVALTLSWTNPEYSIDSNSVKYIVEIDSTNRNFAKSVTRTVTGTRSMSMLAKELNSILLGFGFAFNTAYDIDVRVISSYPNNNERLVSNTLKLRVTPYKIPPKVALPTSGRLFLVGDASDGGWNNPVPVPSQEFSRLDETTFAGVFNLKAGSYLILPINGDWGQKYALTNNGVPGIANGGDFVYYGPGVGGGDNFPSPATSAGLYKIVVDFQTGKFTVTQFTQQHGLPSTLFLVGGATPGGWSNPVPVPSQQFTRVTATRFELASIALTAGEKYLFLPENGNWGKKYGAVNGSAANIGLGGPLKPEGDDMPAPTTSGNYKIVVELANNTYTLTKL